MVALKFHGLPRAGGLGFRCSSGLGGGLGTKCLVQVMWQLGGSWDLASNVMST